MPVNRTLSGYFVLAVILTGNNAWAQTLTYKDASAPIDQRVADLLSRMTLEEKINQMRCQPNNVQSFLTNNAFDPAKADSLKGGIGEISPFDMDPAPKIAVENAIQKFLVEQSRLGIPAIFHTEGCHGLLDRGATSFPAPIGFACTWDPDLMQQCYDVVGKEIRARGCEQALAPVVDICRDPRWGRTDETMGEDPFVNGTLGAAIVRGLQGSNDGTIAPDHVAATLKHFLGHGQPEGGINRGPVADGLRDILDVHMLSFRLAIAGGRPAAVMPAYVEIDGVPCHANRWLLQDELRGELNFGGLIVSDYTGIEYINEIYHLASDHKGAAILALKAGVEMCLPDGGPYAQLAGTTDPELLTMIDKAAAHVLRLKFALGLFEHPYADVQPSLDLPTLESSHVLARKAADESIVLLKNANGILPLDPAKTPTIAVIGPNAAVARLGSYSGEPLYKVSILDGIKTRVANKATILYAEGTPAKSDPPASSMDGWRTTTPVPAATDAENQQAISVAVDTANKADVIILAIGENETLCREAWSSNHLGDRASLDLPGDQQQLADAIFATGKPVIVYLMNGRPLAIPSVIAKASAVLEGWYAGQETGNAAADILFGDVNPSGKLTTTIPQTIGQLPVFYNCKPGARLFDYVDVSAKPLFPFGYGLSYTSFSYSPPTLSAATLSAGSNVAVNTTVTNTGNHAGDEIVEMYIHQKISSVSRPIKELRGFTRIHLDPGQSKQVSIPLDYSQLAFHDIDMKSTVEPGDFEIMVGPSSADTQSVVLSVK